MDALAIMPFAPAFNDVFKTMVRACDRYSGEAERLLGANPRKDQLRQVQCSRIDKKTGTLDIVKGLIDAIRGAAFCIADVTGNNKNVLWELGFAMALEKPVIILTQNRDEVGFDLRNMRNVKYSRDNLEKLESDLFEEIKNVVSVLPDVSSFPAQASYGKALAMSTASPAYYLDQQYTINYMNEAAASLFELNHPAGSYWIGRPLRDFLNSIADRIENLKEVERNLQIQNEHIQEMERAGIPSAICPYNIEIVVLRSNSFGTIELQKTGVAVRDPENGRVNGWVVSFNIISAKDTAKIRKFHEAHKYMIQGRLFWHEMPPKVATPPPQLPRSDNIARWIAQGCVDFRMAKAKNYAEKQLAFEFAVPIMKTERYGLSSVQKLDDWFFDHSQSEYVMLTTPDGDLVGVLRLHPNHDLTQYAGIADWVKDLAADGQTFADVGAYLHPDIAGKNRRACLASLVGYGSYVCESLEQIYMYAQVPRKALKEFQKFMFVQAGTPFSCPGWSPEWLPILLKCVALGRDTPDKQRWDRLTADTEIDESFVAYATRAFLNAVHGDGGW